MDGVGYRNTRSYENLERRIFGGVQERYLVIEEERREWEAQERKRRDEEWNRRMEDNRKWLAEQQAKRKNRQRDPFIEEMMQSLSPEAREKLQQIPKERGIT